MAPNDRQPGASAIPPRAAPEGDLSHTGDRDADVRPTLLFAYGTLRLAEVQLAVFRRRLRGRADALPGYRRAGVRVGPRTYPGAEPTGDPSDVLAGMAFQVSEAELRAADAYETRAYRRVAVTLRSGAQAWVYVRA